MSIQFLVILVPVLFGMMGFAVDLGRLYLIRGELNQAANTMALAAASQLIGTSASTDNATTAATQSIDDSNPLANKYNFGSVSIASGSGGLSTTVNPPAFFATVSDAIGATASQADGTTARHVQINVTADAPLLFWGLLSAGQSRKTPIAAQAVAGISAPLCTACGIEPILVSALDPNDTDNFGFGDPTEGTLYTFGFECLGTTVVQPLPGTTSVVPYGIVNRWDQANATLDETQQLYRDGAAGLLASTNPNPTGSPVPMSCVGVNDAAETIWGSTNPQLCSSQVTAAVSDFLCGLYSRFDNATQPTICTNNVTDFATLSAAYAPDRDVTTGQTNAYTDYIGNGRRIITVAIVSGLATDTVSTMTVIGFRQFLLEPNVDGTFLNPADANGRFVAMYIGSPAPVKQGFVDDRFSLGCPVPISSGPGKVVLHQ